MNTPAAPTRPRWMLPLLIGLVIALLAAGGITAWALLRPAAAAPGGTFTVTGKLILEAGGDPQSTGNACSGSGGYSDISGGASVTVSDATGATIALGRLDGGKADGSLGRMQCAFTFTVPGVPAGKGFYGVEVARRGRTQYTEAELARPLALTLG